jgi:hypothetical protein
MVAILRELLLQSLPRDPAVLPHLYDQCSASAEVKLESPAALKDLTQTVLTGADKLFMVIDGLDECDEPQRKQTLKFLLPLLAAANDKNPGSMRALFTSQDVADMQSQMRRKAEVITLTAKDNLPDIKLYTEYWSTEVGDRFELPADEVRRITDHVIKTANGGFTLLQTSFSLVRSTATLTVGGCRHVPLC